MGKEIEVITLEDGINYVILKIIECTNKYVYLANVDDPNDIVIRKLLIINDEEILAGLDTEEEFEEAISLLNQSTDEN